MMIANFSLLISFLVVSSGASFSVSRGQKQQKPALTFTAFEHEADVSKAREYTEDIGGYSVQEIEDLKMKLRKDRLENFASNARDPTQGVGILENQILAELEFQLDMLQDQIPPSTLFPKDDVAKEAVPHLGKSQIGASNGILDFKMLGKTALEENALEAVMICLVIASLTFMPNLLM